MVLYCYRTTDDLTSQELTYITYFHMIIRGDSNSAIMAPDDIDYTPTTRLHRIDRPVPNITYPESTIYNFNYKTLAMCWIEYNRCEPPPWMRHDSICKDEFRHNILWYWEHYCPGRQIPEWIRTPGPERSSLRS